ncbi:MAG: 23S rRNA (guanosine(2251)-2'-O)-methyltransferase RlmB [Candidatus Poribacteria bacterium]|nr:23S rRNA (guanosine(2251)-2'-O)-methyltransferase RlmB [Candidatus Poribacteria bacterium]
MAHVMGRNPVREALKAGRRVQRVLVAAGVEDKGMRPLLDMAKSRGVAVETVERRHLDELTDGANHQGVVALVSDRRVSSLNELLDQVKTASTALIVLLDHIQDPHNLGAIIRTAECVGADAVIIPKRGAAGVTATVTKVSAGATEHLSVIEVANIAQTIARLQESGFWVVGAESDENAKSIPFTQYDFAVKTAVVIGGEGDGLARLVAESCDTLVHIPLFGAIESLNASVAAGILLYEARRKMSKAENAR